MQDIAALNISAIHSLREVDILDVGIFLIFSSNFVE
jgi:hypothetical protein